MGHDYYYQAIPQDSGLVDLVRSLPAADAHFVQFVPTMLRWGRSILADKPLSHQDKWTTVRPEAATKALLGQNAEGRFWNWCCDAVERFPGIETRNAQVSDWFSLAFVLSARRRRNWRNPKPTFDDPRVWNDPETQCDEVIEYVFQSAGQIAAGVAAGQGVPIRLVSPSIVVDVAACLEALTMEIARERYREVMARHDEPEYNVDLRLPEFLQLRTLFIASALSGDAMMVVCD